jgi:hypothetical protein
VQLLTAALQCTKLLPFRHPLQTFSGRLFGGPFFADRWHTHGAYFCTGLSAGRDDLHMLATRIQNPLLQARAELGCSKARQKVFRRRSIVCVVI